VLKTAHPAYGEILITTLAKHVTITVLPVSLVKAIPVAVVNLMHS